MKNKHKNISKLMSLVLRHQPDYIDVKLDDNGWLPITELLEGIRTKGISIDFDTLVEIVETNDKQRFIINEDRSKIRANQGHSLDVNLNLIPVEPLQYLYHGTVSKFIDAIKSDGLKKMSRQHVHLSKDVETANKVGQRRGKPIILRVNSGKMYKNGYEFYQSANGVWLTDHIPPAYIEFT